MKCPKCGFDVPANMQYCGMCGTRLAQVCHRCGFVNPTTYHFCGMCGVRLPAREEPAPTLEVTAPSESPPEQPQPPAELAPSPTALRLEGERRVATVVMADVRRSMDLLERIGSEAWVEIMNHIFQILEVEIYRFGGTIDQFRGDGLVAFFGATSAHEDDPERAVLASLAMQRAMANYAVELAEREDIDLSLRVGVNTGEVIVASVGDRRQYSEDTAMGEAIAVAARLETAAEPGTVLVSETTYRLVAAQFRWESLGRIKVKGISEPLAVYRPLAPRLGTRAEAEHMPLWVYGPSIPLIGRDAELQTLKGCVSELYDGRGGIVMVTGDRGMGKSFLVTEVRHHLARQGALEVYASAAGDTETTDPRPALTWLRGRCRSFDQSWPYAMWLGLLRDWLAVRLEESTEETLGRLRQRCEQLWGEDMAEYYPYLANLLALPVEPNVDQGMRRHDAEGVQQQFFHAIRSWVEAMAAQGPLVLYFADMHWADLASLELLRYCLPVAENAPVLWLFVYRPDRASPVWKFRYHVETEYPHRLTSLALDPFNRAQSAELIDRLIGPDVLPQATKDLVIDKAEGNPYYIQELIHSLIAQGVLVQEPDGLWRATRAAKSLDLPDSLQSLLMARIDDLPAPARRVLQVASVIGTVFWSRLLEALVNDIPDLTPPLTDLQRAQLIRERRCVSELGMEYVFKSSLIRDIAYDSLLSAQRAKYHLKLAEHIETLPEPELAPYYGMLAYHYRCAGCPDRELSYTLKAADQARERYANAEALEHYTRALELLDGLQEIAEDPEQQRTIRQRRFDALNARGQLYRLMGDLAAWRNDADQALALARKLDEPVRLIDALLESIGVINWTSRSELLAGVELAEEALALSREIGDRRREMLCLGAIASQRFNLNDASWQQVAEQALALARELDERRFEVSLLAGIGRVYVSKDPERSMEYLEMALPICQSLDDKRAELELLRLIGAQLESSSDYYRQLKECYVDQLRLSREVGDRLAESSALMFYGQIEAIYLGDYQAGLEKLEEALALRKGEQEGRLYPLLRVAQVRAMQGQDAQAMETLDEARRMNQQGPADLGTVGLSLVSAIIYNALGDEPHLRRVMDVVAKVHTDFQGISHLSRQYQMVAFCEAAAAHLGWAQLVAEPAARAEHRAQALAASRSALEIYQSFGFVRPIECTSEEILFRHSRALAANGHADEAAAYLQRAYEEMMRKHDLIPVGSHYRRTYLMNIPLHREIRMAYVAYSEPAPVAEGER